MQELRETPQSIRRGQRQHAERQRHRAHQNNHIAQTRAGDEQDREAGREQYRCGAEVGLEQQQERRDGQQSHRLHQARKRLHEFIALAHAITAHPRQNQHFGELGYLEIHRADPHPAARAVDGGPETGDQHQQQQQQPEQQQRQTVFVPQMRGYARKNPRGENTDQSEQELAFQEIERIAEILRRDRHRSRRDHDQPDQQKRGRETERHRVPSKRHALASAHAVGHGDGIHGRPASERTAAANTSPRWL